MHIVFIESVPFPYRIDAPLTRPIGGTQSAVCYLMMALAARGMRVSFINSEPAHEVAGVRCISTQFPVSAISDADVLVMLTAPDPDGMKQFDAWAPKARKVVWLHHAPDQPAVEQLAHAETIKYWDDFVFVSAWQEREYLKKFPLLADARRTILRNAISPAFENLFDDMPILSFKSPAPRLAYSSTPFRGLDRLLFGWPKILSAHPSAELQIFSSMKLYDDADSEAIANLLDAARTAPKVTHVGPVPQPDLAQALRSSLILSYPNTFPETACIAVMEALAAGCIVITSNLAALPETLDGHGVLVDFGDGAEDFANRFADEVSVRITQYQHEWHTGELENRLVAQVKWANENYTWGSRAAEWEKFLTLAATN